MTGQIRSSNNNNNNTNNGVPRWSGLETPGMCDAKCSLLLPDDIMYEPKIKALPNQRVMVYQDKGFYHHQQQQQALQQQNNSENDNIAAESTSPDNFYVDFQGATILQLEPSTVGGTSSKNAAACSLMPITLTVGGRCVLTPENYQDFRVMMRTKLQAQEMNIAPNGNFDWPDVDSLLTCPSCARLHTLPQPHNERNWNEYWMIFYPLLQITMTNVSGHNNNNDTYNKNGQQQQPQQQLTLGTRTICRLMCLDCMEDLLEGLTLRIQPGNRGSSSTTTPSTSSLRLCFTLPVADVLAEAGSASFLEDGPPRPDTHPHIDDVLDAWTLYNLWEHSGAWEALQNDYRVVLSKSMNSNSSTSTSGGTTSNNNNNQGSGAANNNKDNTNSSNKEPRLKERMGKPCGYNACGKVHGQVDPETGFMVRLSSKCRECNSEVYCSKACREADREEHSNGTCKAKQRDREERRERKAKKVQCDSCVKKFPFTKMKKCSRCRQATYCSVECQKADWDRHRMNCQIR